MTLILTEVSRAGIAMAADSAYTPHGGGRTTYHPKVFSSAKLGVGMSMWGDQLPQPPHDWVVSFIRREEAAGTPNVHLVANHLESDLRSACPLARPTAGLDATLGFHVAGFDSGFPVLYHVHNGASQAMAARHRVVNPLLINANPDIDLAESKRILSSSTITGQITRNGDYRIYAIINHLLDPVLGPLDPSRQGAGVQTSLGTLYVPAGKTLVDRSNYLGFQIRLIANLYAVSNVSALLKTTGPHIGGDILALEMDGNTQVGSPRVLSF
jgi:hypothetical protein